MDIKEKLKNWFKNTYKRIFHKPLMHVCRSCHHIFDEEEMNESDPSICKICSRRE